VEVEAPPGSFLEFVTSNVDWTVLEDCDWLSCEPTSGSNINYFTVIYNDNGTSLTRICNITVSHGIIAQSITVTQNPWPNQLDDIKLISHLKIFPNPANNKLNIAGDSLQIQNFDFVISNILGEVIIESGNNILNRIQIDVSTWPKGIYLVMIKTKDGILTRKIVITKYD
jgi:hypothetical protein